MQKVRIYNLERLLFLPRLHLCYQFNYNDLQNSWRQNYKHDKHKNESSRFQ